MTTEAEEHKRTDLPTGTVTFLFTDIEGSTRLSQSLGDGFADLIDRHHDLLRSTIEGGGGTVVSTEGDAFFAVFSEPLEAVSAAAAAQRRLAAEPWPGDALVRVRMGLHTGIGRLGGDDYAGVEVNRAARISGAGHGGQVLLSASTAALVSGGLPDGLGTRDLGAIMLKDFEDAEVVRQLEMQDLPGDFPPLRAARPGHLPQPLTSFVGRGEVERAVSLVRQRRLVTLTGPGGTGKTRLSIEAASGLQPEFRGGAWFVPLETIRDRALVLPAIADGLGVAATPGRPLIEVVAGHVADKPTLLVLDNLEQVVDVGPDLARLLEAAPDLRILASSREPLRIGGEQEMPVPVLDEMLAVELFVDRARQVRPDLDPSEDERNELRGLVKRLDHLPLAIELAAARARRYSISALCEQLPARLVELDSGRRDAVDRQRTLRGAVAWSHELLTPMERRTFDHFAVFAGGAELAMLGSIIDPARPADQVMDEIESLADKSLLGISDGPDGEPRARMLETIHAFAMERLEQDPEHEAIRTRHAGRFLGFCEAIEPELTSDRSDVALARMETEHDNVRAALGWAQEHDPALGLRIGGAIWRFWQQRAHMAEAQERLEALLEVADESEDRCALGRGCTALGGARYWQGDYQAARRAYEDAVEHYRACGDDGRLAGALYDLSYPVAIIGDAERAAALIAESVRTFEALGDEAGMALVKEGQAVQAVIAGDYEQARGLQQEVVAYHRRQGGLFQLADNIGLLVMIEARLGHAAEARALLEEVRGVQRRLRDRSGLAGALEIRALVAAGEGDLQTVALCAGAVQGMRDRGGSFLVPSEVLGLDDPSVEARERLGPRYAILYEAGRAMDPEQVFLDDSLAAGVT